jgi:hypothetical protein
MSGNGMQMKFLVSKWGERDKANALWVKREVPLTRCVGFKKCDLATESHGRRTQYESLHLGPLAQAVDMLPVKQTKRGMILDLAERVGNRVLSVNE